MPRPLDPIGYVMRVGQELVLAFQGGGFATTPPSWRFWVSLRAALTLTRIPGPGKWISLRPEVHLKPFRLLPICNERW